MLKKTLKPLHHSLKSLLTILAFVFMFTCSFIGINTASVHAAPVVGFNAGKIIDDAVFTNATTMNVAQIQAFFNSKVSTCDTQGTQPSEFGGGTRAQWAANASLHPKMGAIYPPFTCIKDYSENNNTAAQIIYNAAKTYNINPQVLIVLLQKEQSLVTDTWPLSVQYKTATGYGCPDTAACDSQYYGLTNQITWSAKMFRAILNNSPTWYTPYILGNNYIRWSPDSTCGGGTVNIQNRATQALYNYTPYQPNQSALNAGYGNGDSCGAYGNRNFYLYFTDWFGSTNYIFGNAPSNTSLYSKQPCSIDPFSETVVGRLYNPDTRDFLYTTSSTEACVAVRYGYIWDGIVMKNAAGQDTIPVYRLSNSERHLYTSSVDVKNQYIDSFGYKDEGIGFYVYSSAATGRIPVKGLQHDQTFFITSSGREAIYYASEYNFYNYGTIYYTDALSTEPTPVYRITRNNSRLYTTSSIEKASAIARYGFSDEGTVSLNDAGPNDANLPTYRLRSPYGGYIYTTSRTERDYAIVNYSHMSEGIAFYGLLWSNAPVYRATSYQNLMRIYTSSNLEYNNAATAYGYVLEGVSWYGY